LLLSGRLVIFESRFFPEAESIGGIELMHVLKVIFVMLEVLVLFNLLIFVHELGHFLAARWRGLKIDRFAIWFGKPIWKTKINGVEYALGSIPAGGYVSLPQMAPMEAIEGKSSESTAEQLPPISALDKIIVAFAGPLFSFGLALAFAVVVWVVGRPVSEAETTTTIGYVVEGGPAAKAGLKPGDKVLEVDNAPITKFGGMGSSITWRIVSSEGTTVPVKVLRDGKECTFLVTPTKEETKAWERKSLRKIQIGPAQTAKVDSVITNSPAALAKLQPGDEILAMNGDKIYSYDTVEDYAERHGSNQMSLTISRGGKDLDVALKPEVPLGSTTAKAHTGIVWDGGKVEIKHPGPGEQITGSLDAMFSTFGALFSKKSDIKPQHLGGAIKIFSIYYLLFQSEDGWRLALWFSVLMNINLALLNMLPFPVLDGGHIALALVEAVRKRPVSIKILGYVQTTCAAVLIGYMLYIAFYDAQDLIPGHGKSKEPTELKFAPKTESNK
jgi:regulator of sigma E protease